jgi:alkylhydroperoxidase family enzyme
MRTEAELLFERLEAQVLGAEGRTPPADRQSAASSSTTSPELDALLDKVRREAHRVTDEDVTAVRRAGYDEDSVFELTIAAAVGVARRRLDLALDAIAEEAR